MLLLLQYLNNSYAIERKLIKLEIYASGEIWITVVVNIADNS